MIPITLRSFTFDLIIEDFDNMCDVAMLTKQNQVNWDTSMRAKLWRVGILGFLVTVLLIACAQLVPKPQSNQPKANQTSTLIVAAAASLQKSLQEITSLYAQGNPNQIINYNFAASGALQQQIEQGAPADVFISASAKQMKALQEKGLLESGTQKNLLTNQLVLIIPKQTSVPLTNFKQLLQIEVKRISVGEPRSVPAGQYAIEVLKNLGILEQVQSKFVFGSHVKSVLTAVETGDVDAGIVYITDAKGSGKVTIAATVDEKLHAPIVYPIAVLKESKSLDESKKYVKFLQSNIAKAIFEKYGFGIANP
jgi:molybdate transport system substrate-binding protein